MKIITEKYIESLLRLPENGQCILGHQSEELIVVYQAYKKSIADSSVENQCLGGAEFSYNRMSWIKPNFLWMMFRCGWAEKENQESVLALWITKTDFENILNQAVYSSFTSQHYDNHDLWRKELDSKEVRLQWDPDHDPLGNKLERRAIQLGLKGKVLENFGQQQIKKVEDITDFVREQKSHLDNNRLDELIVPIETVYQPSDKVLSDKLGIN